MSFSAEAAATFQSELLTFAPSCDLAQSGALLAVDVGFTARLNVRGLRVLPPVCASAGFSILSDHVRLVNCSDGGTPCGGAATCTDVAPLPWLPNVTTADCSCQGGFFPNPTATSIALAPYGFDPSTIGLPDPIVDYCVRCGA